MTTITEQHITFSFSDNWEILQFDETKDYTKMEKSLNGSKGVDFLGIYKDKDCCFIEVKDFRGSRIENKKRITSEELFIEIGQKVKDSLACIIASARNSTLQMDFWKENVRNILNSKSNVRVVLWMEEDMNIAFGNAIQEKRGKISKNIQLNKLQSKMSWLTSNVHIVSTKNMDKISSRLGISATLNSNPVQ